MARIRNLWVRYYTDGSVTGRGGNTWAQTEIRYKDSEGKSKLAARIRVRYCGKDKPPVIDLDTGCVAVYLKEA